MKVGNIRNFLLYIYILENDLKCPILNPSISISEQFPIPYKVHVAYGTLMRNDFFDYQFFKCSSNIAQP